MVQKVSHLFFYRNFESGSPVSIKFGMGLLSVNAQQRCLTPFTLFDMCIYTTEL